jgi:hypothetical protein
VCGGGAIETTSADTSAVEGQDDDGKILEAIAARWTSAYAQCPTGA